MMEQRILDFMDGNLGGSDEEELLHTLAVSPERRSLLKQHLKLREFAGALGSHPLLTVPHSTTTTLFNQLSENGFRGGVPVPGGSPASFEPIAAAIAPQAISSASAPAAGRMLAYAGGIVAAFLLGIWMQNVLGGSVSTTGDQHKSLLEVNPMTARIQTQEHRTFTSGTTARAAEILTPQSIRGVVGRVVDKSNQHATGVESLVGMAAADRTDEVSGGVPRSVKSTPSVPVGLFMAIPNVAEMRSTSNVHSPESAQELANIEQKANIRQFDESLGDAKNDNPLTFAMRTAAGPGPTLGFGYINSLSEAKVSWQATRWLSLKASLGELESYETQAISRGSSAGVTLISTAPSLNFSTLGSLELGLDQTLFGIPMELAAGVGADQSGLLYPRGSLFGMIVLGNGMMLNLGVEGVTYMHDVTSSVRAKQQALIGSNPAVEQHTSSERLGFFGPSLEFSWQP